MAVEFQYVVSGYANETREEMLAFGFTTRAEYLAGIDKFIDEADFNNVSTYDVTDRGFERPLYEVDEPGCVEALDELIEFLETLSDTLV